MIDMLVLRCEIRDNIEISYKANGSLVVTDTTNFLNIKDLEIPLQGSVDEQGEITGLFHAWESIPSSYGSLAFKVFDFRNTKDGTLFVEIKASPAKLMLGHNVFGSDDLSECGLTMFEILYTAYPTLADYLNHESWTVSQIDVTYHSRCKTQDEVTQFINALHNVSNGQTKSRTGYSGTAYFGKKNSRIKKLKVYDKYKEVLAYMSRELKRKPDLFAVYTDELLEFSKCMVRWESSVKTRWLQRRNLPTNFFKLAKIFDAKSIWKESTKDIFKALEGQQMRIIKDDHIKKQLEKTFYTVSFKTGKISYTKALSAYRTYRAIKADGYKQVSESMSRATFFRHIKMLQEIGLSKILIQNLEGEGIHNEVIPMVRYADVVFENQIPDFAPARLRLVA